jgi:hypothetical protein
MSADVFGLISQIIGSIPSSFQMFYGGSQLNEAKKLEGQTVRPTAQIAPSVDRLASYMYGKTLAQDIPGGEIARNEIKGATAAGMRVASEMGSGSEAYGMLGQLVGREQDAFSGLAKETLGMGMDYDKLFAEALRVKADEENRVWQWNKVQPYMQAIDRINWLRSSGTQNQFSGAQGLSDSASQYMDYMGASQSGGGGGTSYSDADVKQKIEVLGG